MGMFTVKDEFSLLCNIRVKNETFACCLAFVQLIVTVVSFGQHVYSFIEFNDIFKCSFNNSQGSWILSYDIIIFDFGLFNQLIAQLNECIANKMDGGYLRCLWCVSQAGAIIILFAIKCTERKHPLYVCPMLLLQNCYCFGLMILTIATADKFLLAILSPRTTHQLLLIAVFFAGTALNHILNYILWHLFWHLEAAYKLERGKPFQTWV